MNNAPWRNNALSGKPYHNVCQMLELYNHYNIQSRGFDTLRDLVLVPEKSRWTNTTATDALSSPGHQQPWNGPLARYVKLRVAHASGMPGTFSPPLRLSDPDMHHGTCVTHVPWCMPGSLSRSFLFNVSRGKRSRHSRRMRKQQFCESGKRPIDCIG